LRANLKESSKSSCALIKTLFIGNLITFVRILSGFYFPDGLDS
jgi:hypothetical protein